MRWTLRIAAILAVLLMAYAIWPVVGFFRIASAIEARDAAALDKLVDFRALRKNLTKQIVAAYIELTGKEKKLGLLGKSLAVGVGTSYAEPIVAQLLNEQTLMDLLTKGEGGMAASRCRPSSRRSPSSAVKSGWQTWWASEYGLGDYYVSLPPDKASRQAVQGEAQPHRPAMEACRHRSAGADEARAGAAAGQAARR